MSSPITAAPALMLAEILDSIFEHLDPAHLTVCARVNNLWHDLVSARLWHGSVEPTSKFRTPTIKQMLLMDARDHSRLVSRLASTRALRLTLGTDFVDAGVWAGFCLPCAARRFVGGDPYQLVRAREVRIVCDHPVVLELLQNDRLIERVLWEGLRHLSLEAIPLDSRHVLSEDVLEQIQVRKISSTQMLDTAN